MDLHTTCVDTLKCLAMDMIQRAESGHPGLPLGAAGLATVLWRRFLRHDPADPSWPDRDRFVLSAGHGSALLYGLLHLSGYDLGLDDLKAFRQWGSRTPGHPERGHTPGVETTTGPLGQGIANAVGMALAERYLRERFGADLVDHRTWVLAGDGCMMEGISSEAASLAGHLGLGRLTVLYDDNHITIDGTTDIAFTEDVCARFAAFGWRVARVDGHDPEAVEAALREAAAQEERPTLLACRTHLAHGTSMADNPKAHGSPLGPTVIAAAKAAMGLDPAASFAVPDEAYAAFRAHDGPARRAAWERRLAEHPRRAELRDWLSGDGEALASRVSWPTFAVGSQVATRKANAAALKAVTAVAPQVLGGSADLSESNGTHVGLPYLSRERFPSPGAVAFGIREHAMGAICNGMAAHGGLVPYDATFLVFHDYQRPAVRLACLMGLRVVHVYSHDSVLLGEDGPTHQPVETLAALRAIPNMRTIRPADAAETIEAWKLALAHRTGPTAIVVTRQGLPVLAGVDPAGFRRGGYVLAGDGPCDVCLVATGSEVSLALAARELLAAEGIAARVVSMPCPELFLAQEPAWRARVLPPGTRCASLEAGVTMGWERVVGSDGLRLGIETFGASAPPAALAEAHGLTPPQVAAKIRAFLGR